MKLEESTASEGLVRSHQQEEKFTENEGSEKQYTLLQSNSIETDERQTAYASCLDDLLWPLYLMYSNSGEARLKNLHFF